MSLGEYLGAGSGITKGLYHLNGNSNDSSGNGNNGSDTNISYGLAYGKFRQGAGFNGSSWITFPSSMILPVTTTNQTYSVWFKLASTASNQTILESLTKTGSTDCLLQYITSGTYFRIGVVYQQIGSAYFKTISLNDTNWHHAVLTVSNNNSMTAYFDGNSLGTLSMSSTGSSVSYNNLSVGHDINYISGASQNPMANGGNIDEVIIENVAWSAEKVKKYYTYSRGRFGIL